MPQLIVTGYALQIGTRPLQQPGAPATPFRAGVALQFQSGGPFEALPINGWDEFMAVAALIQTPGRLIYDSQRMTLEKVSP